MVEECRKILEDETGLAALGRDESGLAALMESVNRLSGGAYASPESLGRRGNSVALVSKMRARSSSHALTRLSKASRSRREEGSVLPSPGYSLRQD
eukprot:986607-Pleurochrysis_carterae.AAC.5